VWARFTAPNRTDPGAHPASYKMGTGLFPRKQRPGCGVNHPPSSRVQVKGRGELDRYPTSVPSQAIGVKFTFNLCILPVYYTKATSFLKLVEFRILIESLTKNVLLYLVPQYRPSLTLDSLHPPGQKLKSINP